MAKQSEIESEITLELDGDVSPTQLAKALSAFSALITASHKKNGTTMHWTVQAKKGSNLVGFYPAKNSSPINPSVLQTLEHGFEQLAAGTEQPAGFDPPMMGNMVTLCGIPRDNHYGTTSLSIWLQKKPYPVTKALKTTVVRSAGIFEEPGMVRGRLQKIDSHESFEFAIYEPLRGEEIVCTPQNETVSEEAVHLFNSRVEAEGLVKYKGLGIPYEMCVERFYLLPEPKDIPAYLSTRGILKKYV